MPISLLYRLLVALSPAAPERKPVFWLTCRLVCTVVLNDGIHAARIPPMLMSSRTGSMRAMLKPRLFSVASRTASSTVRRLTCVGCSGGLGGAGVGAGVMTWGGLVICGCPPAGSCAKTDTGVPIAASRARTHVVREKLVPIRISNSRKDWFRSVDDASLTVVRLCKRYTRPNDRRRRRFHSRAVPPLRGAARGTLPPDVRPA